MTGTGRFSRSERLLDSRDFRRVSRCGRRSASRYFVLLTAPARVDTDGPGCVRLGITVSRKVGNAVVRNYIKRSVREWFRASCSKLEPRDMVVIARKEAAGLGSAQVAGALGELALRDATRARGSRS